MNKIGLVFVSFTRNTKGHEANFIQPLYLDENEKNYYHLLILPIDFNYTFPNKIGLHFGVELAT